MSGKLIMYLSFSLAALFGFATYYHLTTSSTFFGREDEIIPFSAFMAIIGLLLPILALSQLRKGRSSSGQGKRRAFSPETKERTMEQQGGRCNKCGKIPRHWEFDHKRGRDDNSFSNCQGLCRDCHQDKTMRERR